MDYETLITHKLLPGHKLISTIKAGLVQEFVKTPRILALIEGFEASPNTTLAAAPALSSGTSTPLSKWSASSRTVASEVERAVLVLRSCTQVPFSPDHLTVETVLPVDARFTYNIDSEPSNEVLILNLSSARHKLLFEMTFSQRTSTFVSEVLKAAEGVSKRKAPTPEFTWLKPYLANTSSGSSSAIPSNKPSQQASETSSICSGAGGGGTTANTNTDKIFTIESSGTNFLVNLDDGTNSTSSSSNSPRLPGKHNNNSVSSNSSSAAGAAATKGLGSFDVTTDGMDSHILLPDDMSMLRISSEYGDRSKFYEASCTPIAARESHVRHQMALKEASYTHNTTLTVFIGTWNVNGVLPSIGLADWLAVDQDPPDIYALGFQELDLDTGTIIFNATPKESEWRTAVAAGVHPAARYKQVACVRLVGMLLLVLVQEKHASHVNNIQSSTVATGIMNLLGNKGGVAARMDVYNTSVCFVNCHLAAHVEEYERRNEDYDGISEKTVFLGNAARQTPARYIRDHTHIYFFGDMNYRIPPHNVDVRHLASNNEYKTLLSLDQLNIQKGIGRVFKGYNEGEITFRPTFKYDLNTDNWDSSEKARQPAWCDRVLWAGEGIQQVIYRSHMQLKISDHKPVSSIFHSQVKVIDVASYRRVHEEVMKQLDKMENDLLPSVELSVSEIILKPVQFLQPQHDTLTISNTGQISVQFAFINKLNDERCCKPWLKIHPMAGLIKPGTDCVVQLDIKVDHRSASALNSGAEQMYDILVLHLDGGKDFFITITGDYQRSCFGSSINALVNMNKPFSEVPVAQLIDLESSSPKFSLDLPYAIPKEMWYLVDHLHAHAQQSEGLFCRPGLNKEILEIRACLDAGAPSRVLPGSVHSVAEVLMLLLEALPEPVVPYTLYLPAVTAAKQGIDASKLVFDQMPPHHRNVFTYLMAFLKELLVHKEQNKLDAINLARAFGMLMLREPPAHLPFASNIKIDDADLRKQMFVHHFLVNEY
uniref:phosphoinositide 5-phosphatase n=2 Tax=Hirondellea gigas TaxID=1518452 RepID=A0A6A7FUV4_9CRUS